MDGTNTPSKPMTSDEEKLEAQIAAQEAGDLEAAGEAAEIPDEAPDQTQHEGYPRPVEEPAHMPEDAEGEPDQQNEQPAPPQVEEAQTRPSPTLREGFDIKIFRLANGEWIVGQFRVYADEQGEAAIAFYKVFRYQIGQHPQNGQMMVNMSAWPVEEGSLELSEVTANGNPNAGTHGVNIGDAYLQFISPIAKANQQQAAAAAKQENKKRARAQRILDAGGRF